MSLLTTVVLLVVYASIFITVFFSNQLPPLPKSTHGLRFQQAFSDLQTVTQSPHPYNSHANDVLREYILSRLTNITAPHQNAHLVSDLSSTAAFFTGSHAVYFEGTNILVKIDGSDPDYQLSGGVLFSAHYDSVSTAPGASDNGIGLVTMMAMVQHFLEEERPQKTVVFNFNNGEEDGLYGAHAYLEHPWSNITSTFLNVDAAAAGGRPIIFRSTSMAPLTAFTHPHVSHPHANVLSADAYARGVIRSYTDYQVYTKFQPALSTHGMQGVDLALYKHRAFYHTKYDSIPGAGVDGKEGAAKALWAMMEVVMGGGMALARVGGDVEVLSTDAAVYFDLFASVMVLFPLSVLLTSNIVLLIIGPVVVLLVQVGMWGIRRAHATDRARSSGNGNASAAEGGIYGQVWRGVSRWIRAGVSFWFRFWVMLVVVVGLQVVLVVGHLRIGSGFTVYSSPYLVLTSALALAYLSVVLVLAPLFHSTPATPLHHRLHALPLADAQKNSVLLQTYVLTWVLLVASTIAVGQLGVGGVYLVSAWNVVVFGGVLVGVVEALVWALWTGDVAPESEERVEQGSAGEDVTEETPLLRTQPSPTCARPGTKQDGAMGWWFVQLLLVVPVPVILMSHIGIIVLGALPQTLVDGSSAVYVYAAISAVSVLLVLPLAPFAHKIHGSLSALILAVFILSTVYAWTAFPFTMDAPLKVFFQQRVHLTPTPHVLPSASAQAHAGYATYAPAEVRTYLTGLSAFLGSVVAQLPSARGRDVRCAPAKGRPTGMATCEWEVDVDGGMSPDPGSGAWQVAGKAAGRRPWLAVNATRLGAHRARIAVRGVNARTCSLSFTRGVGSWRVVREGGGESNIGSGGAGSERMQSGYAAPEGGVEALLLYSRTWESEFVVEVGWDGGVGLEGTVACQWAEYESARVGVPAGGAGGRIPVLEEAVRFVPLWVAVSKAGAGLVEGWAEFSV